MLRAAFFIARTGSLNVKLSQNRNAVFAGHQVNILGIALIVIGLVLACGGLILQHRRVAAERDGVPVAIEAGPAEARRLR